jgi:hypothetical protein
MSFPQNFDGFAVAGSNLQLAKGILSMFRHLHFGVVHWLSSAYWGLEPHHTAWAGEWRRECDHDFELFAAVFVL